MKKLLWMFSLLPLAGCGGPYMAHVYGKSGATFTAPSVCAALVQCLNANETACYYDKTVLTTGTTTEESGCKEVKK